MTTTMDDDLGAFFTNLDDGGRGGVTPQPVHAERHDPHPESRHPCLECNGTGKFLGTRVHQAKGHCFACKGKEFDGKVYLYINQITAKQKSEVLGLLPQDDVKILLSVEQAKQHRVTNLLGKTFKYSHKKKLANMQYTGNYHNWVIGECEQNHGKIYGYLYQRIVD